eukprot:TRINITY_DN65610_c0_g1_i1.p1 TRINITY_DN65610_c0_g1~~TRINITY_DN65610_c0_g1_i1.p1  ORF type:complete len:235 (+),score=106.21 TRINITY_DN65610_c0_g1_i1:58-705(+)
MPSIGHVVSAFLSMVSVLFASVLLGDGRALMTLESDHNTTLWQVYPYGFGVYYDQQGSIWVDDANPFRGYHCEEHERRAQVLKGGSFIVLSLSFVAVAVHLAGGMTGQKILGLLGIGLQGLLFACYVVMVGITGSLYDGRFHCSGAPHRLRLRDDFDLNYGIALMVIGTCTSVVALVMLIVTGATAEEPVAEAEAEEAAVMEEKVVEEADAQPQA